MAGSCWYIAGCFMGVTWVLGISRSCKLVRDIAKVIPSIVSRGFKGVSMGFHGCFMDVSWVFYNFFILIFDKGYLIIAISSCFV